MSKCYHCDKLIEGDDVHNQIFIGRGPYHDAEWVYFRFHLDCFANVAGKEYVPIKTEIDPSGDKEFEDWDVVMMKTMLNSLFPRQK